MDPSVRGEIPEQSKAEALSQLLYETALFAFGGFEVSTVVKSRPTKKFQVKCIGFAHTPEQSYCT